MPKFGSPTSMAQNAFRNTAARRKRDMDMSGPPPGLTEEEWAEIQGLPVEEMDFSDEPMTITGKPPRQMDFSDEPMTITGKRKPTMKDVLNFDNKGMGSMKDALSYAQQKPNVRDTEAYKTLQKFQPDEMGLADVKPTIPLTDLNLSQAEQNMRPPNPAEGFQDKLKRGAARSTEAYKTLQKFQPDEMGLADVKPTIPLTDLNLSQAEQNMRPPDPFAQRRGQADMDAALGDIDEVLGRYGLDKKKKQTPGAMPGGFRQGGL